jgi:hypothetical protein
MYRALCLLLSLILIGSAEVVTFSNSWAPHPLFNIISESATGVEIVFSTHAMVIEEMTVDGAKMKTFGVPGIFLPTEEGAPNLAGTGRYIAIPQGSQVQVTILDSRTEVYHNIDVAPSPNIPLESDNMPLRYVKDMQIYARDAYYPQEPVIVSEPRKIRGVDVVIVGISPFQYNPVTKTLIVYKDIRMHIDFIGGNGHFGDDRLRSRFWEPILQHHLLNYHSLPEIDFFTPQRSTGIDYIIIVPNNPLFRPWADSIKKWRTLEGINTEVYSLWEIGGTSADDIEDFLDNAYNTWNPAPSAFLLLADYPVSGIVFGDAISSGPGIPIGGWNGITSPRWNNYCISDNVYADVDGDDLPDMYHARICAENVIQLQRMVEKIFEYERAPYTASSFYNEPLVSCGWQSDRWFQLCSEVIRGFFIHVFDKNPARQYAIISGTIFPGCAWSTAPNTEVVVAYWHDCGYIPLTNPYDAAWWSNGSASGINAAISSGAFIVQHRDHGEKWCWGDPRYTTVDIGLLFNDKLPFVYSTNCLTGKFNWGLECFTEKFHRSWHGGALGLNAASDVSYSFVNDTYIWGTYDGLWSEFDPGYPGIGSDHELNRLKPCQAMIYGKYYLEASSWPYNEGNKDETYHLFHHHGDAFMTLYSEVPQELSVNHDNVLSAGETSFGVRANYDAVIALTVNGEIIGVGIGEGTTPTTIDITPQEPGDTMLVTITKANYYRYTALVPITDECPPVAWTQVFGGSQDDWGNAVEATSDCGFILTGWTRSFGTGCDVYLVKTDPAGNLTWQKNFGGDNTEWGYDVQQTTDEGYIITGYTSSYGAGRQDVYLIKTNYLGDSVWTNRFGGDLDDVGRAVIEVADGYIIAGYTRSFGVGAYDILLIKTDQFGNKLWQETYGADLAEWGFDVEQTSDGGYIIVGKTSSSGAGAYDVYLVKTNALGNMSWQKTFGGTQSDYGQSVKQTSDGGYIIAGATASLGAGSFDVYLIKTNSQGNLSWYKTFGGTGSDYGYDVEQTSDNGFIIAGKKYSYTNNSYDVYIIKTDSVGNLEWQKTVGGPQADGSYSLTLNTDGACITVGETCSFTPDRGPGPPQSIGSSVYLVCIAPYGSTQGIQETTGQPIAQDNTYSLQIYPNPFHKTTVINYIIPHVTAATESELYASLTIYDITGRLVKSFDREALRTNGQSNHVIWDGIDDRGRSVANGIYFVILEHNTERLQEKIILMK